MNRPSSLRSRDMSRTTFLRLECAVSLGLVLVALAWAWLRGMPLANLPHATARHVVAGAAAGAMLWLTIPLLVSLPEMRRVWTTLLAPFARTLSTADIVLIALLSGISEELFFRGVLLTEVGIVASSLLFGLLHALNRVYAAWAALTGAAFALLAIYSGTLVTPMVAHGLYNLGALLALRHWNADATATAPGASSSGPGL